MYECGSIIRIANMVLLNQICNHICLRLLLIVSLFHFIVPFPRWNGRKWETSYPHGQNSTTLESC